jgi:hypothetical protein
MSLDIGATQTAVVVAILNKGKDCHAARVPLPAHLVHRVHTQNYPHIPLARPGGSHVRCKSPHGRPLW